MRPVDPRLLRYARSTRGFLILAVVLGAVIAALVIVQARLLATAIVDVAEGRADLATISGVLAALAAVFIARHSSTSFWIRSNLRRSASVSSVPGSSVAKMLVQMCSGLMT